MSHKIHVDDHIFEVFIPEQKLQERVAALASEISADYQGRKPIIICVLNGAFMFFSDLVRNLTIDCEVDFIKISSYGNDMNSSGTILFEKEPAAKIAGADVIIVEDIVDSGLSVQYLDKHFRHLKPKSLAFVTLLKKNNDLDLSGILKYTGFAIDHKFVIGYGLDIAQQKRNLRDVYQLSQS
jgi:hypoxanthine phosphoribosyltransferase